MVSAILPLMLLINLMSGVTGTKTLVILENFAIKETHSLFLGELTSSGHELTYKMADDSTLSVFHYGELTYDNLVILAPSTHDFGGDVSAASLAAYVDRGGNVIVAGDTNIGDAIRDFGFECGVEFEESGTLVMDHLNYDISDEGAHSKLVIEKDNLYANNVIVGEIRDPILYEGIGIVLDQENELLMSIMWAPSSAYSFFPQDKLTEHPEAVGTSTSLIAALQARNNARVVFFGSMSLLSDEFILSSVRKYGTTKDYSSGNRQLIRNILQWALKNVGILRIKEVRHHLVGEHTAPSYYTVTEDVEFVITIEELVQGKWEEFKNNDVQMEFVRIDPFIRMNMKKENGSYVAKFKLPDVYGVFQFKVNYNRQGYTFLSSATQVSVRPLQHTQYERFLPVAYPYYASAFSMMFGVLIFSFVFLHFREANSKQKSS